MLVYLSSRLIAARPEPALWRWRGRGSVAAGDPGTRRAFSDDQKLELLFCAFWPTLRQGASAGHPPPPARDALCHGRRSNSLADFVLPLLRRDPSPVPALTGPRGAVRAPRRSSCHYLRRQGAHLIKTHDLAVSVFVRSSRAARVLSAQILDASVRVAEDVKEVGRAVGPSARPAPAQCPAEVPPPHASPAENPSGSSTGESHGNDGLRTCTRRSEAVYARGQKIVSYGRPISHPRLLSPYRQLSKHTHRRALTQPYDDALDAARPPRRRCLALSHRPMHRGVGQPSPRGALAHTLTRYTAVLRAYRKFEVDDFLDGQYRFVLLLYHCNKVGQPSSFPPNRAWERRRDAYPTLVKRAHRTSLETFRISPGSGAHVEPGTDRTRNAD
ncbi:hypothetical protein EVAR_37056_1 [Eumeta japonica]|uniref:Uncharacterized protein n=1 Tax=Eumeta variegata TaxID=151549 RepID=A0A4C1WFP5_EUMVA|nr:hypothetical protein EVAR_37056_1 [Eumeta japonica]